MTIRRTLATAAASLVLLVSLTACFGLPGLPTTGGNTGTGTDTALVDTSWSGTDSDGDFWAFTFQGDNSVAVTLNDNSYDDASDTWSLSGNNLHISVAFDDGEATFDGSYSDGASSIELDGQQGDAEWTFTITKD